MHTEQFNRNIDCIRIYIVFQADTEHLNNGIDVYMTLFRRYEFAGLTLNSCATG